MSQLVNSGDTAWVVASTALVMIMIPGLGYFYSGMTRHKNALSLIFLSLLSLAVVSIQWTFWGFSLAFSPTGGRFIGNFDKAFYNSVVYGTPYNYPGVSNIPTSVYMAYQGMFAAITPALAFGGAAERLRVLPSIIFLVVWNVIAYWTWAPNGWLKVLGGLDFAGGTPVHIASGAAGLAFAIVMGRRHNMENVEEFKPHNMSSVFLGTALLWFGWFGFNGGSELAANARAGNAILVTNISTCSAALTWILIDYHFRGKPSGFGFCSGAIAGLVAITPASGYVAAPYAVLIGVFAAMACYGFIAIKHRFGFDDALDVFGIHGIGGVTGNLLTGIFASNTIAASDGTSIPGGWIDGNFIQILIQLAGSIAGLSWSFGVTFLLLKIMQKVPFLNLRLEKEDELLGFDQSELGENAYQYISVIESKHQSIISTPSLADYRKIVEAPEVVTSNEHHANDLEMNVISK